MKSCVAPDPLRPSSGLSHGKVPERRSEFVHGVWGKRWGQNNHPNLDHLRAFGSQRHPPPWPLWFLGERAWERGRPAGTGGPMGWDVPRQSPMSSDAGALGAGATESARARGRRARAGTVPDLFLSTRPPHTGHGLPPGRPLSMALEAHPS